MVAKKTIGTRAEVWHGKALRTSGGLAKHELMMNKHGRIVSKQKHNTAKKEMRLLKHGYGTKKGHFGFVKLHSKTRKSKSKKHRGGSGMNSIYPADLNSNYMIDYVTPQKFTPLDRALVGGKSRRRYHGGKSLEPADVNSHDITGFSSSSNNVQMRAGLSGGKYRHKHRGGTTKPSLTPSTL